MRYPTIQAVGRVLVSLLVGPLLGVLAGMAYAAVYGGVYWLTHRHNSHLPAFGVRCAAGGAALGLFVALWRAIYVLRSSPATPHLLPRTEAPRLRPSLSADDPRRTRAPKPDRAAALVEPVGRSAE